MADDFVVVWAAAIIGTGLMAAAMNWRKKK